MVEGSRFTGDLRGRIRLGSVLAVSLVAVAVALTFWTGGCGSDHGGAPPSPSHVSFNTNNQPLWVANGTNVLEFAGPYKSHTPNIAPATTLDTPADFTSAQGVQFDDTGDLWVIDQGNPGATVPVPASLNEFTATQIAPGGTLTLTPAVTITSSSLSLPKQGVFDSAGNLWVTDNTPIGTAGVVMFSAAQLATSGAKVASAAIESADFAGGPLGIAFDSAGNLWVSNHGNNTIMEFTKANLPAVGAGGVPRTPTVILSATASSIDGPWGLEFDSAGDLWSSNKTASTVVAFAAASIATTGSPAAAVTLSSVDVGKSKVPSLNSPEGIDFDGVGDLAVANPGAPVGPTPSPSPSASPTATATASPSPTASPTASPSPTPVPIASVPSIAIFAAKQLTAGGAVAPQVLISGSDTLLTAPAGVVFGPSAATPTPTASPSSSPTSSASPTSSPSVSPTATPTM